MLMLMLVRGVFRDVSEFDMSNGVSMTTKTSVRQDICETDAKRLCWHTSVWLSPRYFTWFVR